MKSQHDGKLCIRQTAPGFDLTDSPLHTHTLQGQTHSHTHYIHFSLDIPVGGICSLLRNNWHSEREYTAGICPWFPRLTGARAAQAWQGGRVPSPGLHCSQSTKHLSASTDGCRIQERTSGEVCTTTSLALLMIGRLVFLFGETLTCALSGQIHRESSSSQSSNHRELTPARSDANQLQECLMLTVEMLSGLIKMQDSTLGMLSHH